MGQLIDCIGSAGCLFCLALLADTLARLFAQIFVLQYLICLLIYAYIIRPS